MGLYQNDDAGCGVFILSFMIFLVDAVPFSIFQKVLIQYFANSIDDAKYLYFLMFCAQLVRCYSCTGLVEFELAYQNF